jgi:hypothetical protein
MTCLRRNAVCHLHPRSHELDAAPGDDVGLESVGGQISQQLHHRLVHHLGIRPLGFWVRCGGEPVAHDLVELLGGHAGVRGHYDFEYRTGYFPLPLMSLFGPSG